MIDAEIKKIVDEAYAKALEIIRENRDKLDLVVEFLMKHDVMDRDEFEVAMSGSTVEEIEKIGEERRRKSEEENALREKYMKEEREREEREAREREEREREAEQQQQDTPRGNAQRFPWEEQ